MDSSINFQIEDGGNLIETVENNLTRLKEKGFSDESLARLKAALEDAELKETAQNNAVAAVQNKTAEQDSIVAGVYNNVKIIRDSVRSAFEGYAAILAQFKTDEAIPRSVKNLVSFCKYLNPLVVEKKEILLVNNLMQSNIDDLGTAETRIKNADAEQESAKKIQVSATMQRNNAAKKLKSEMGKVRSFVKTLFANEPEFTVLFDPIPKGRGGGGNGKDDTTPPETPPTT
jgi:hypothetical protein